MQRILSLATLGVLGGLVWMFLSGGGLNQLAAPSNPAAPQQAGAWNAGGGLTFPSATQTGQQTAPPTAQQASTVVAPPSGVGPTIRIASFNIRDFGKAKAEREEVILTLADIVRQFHVVAIQEVSSSLDRHFIPNFVQLINQSGRRYDAIVGPPVGWNTSNNKEQFAFIFDTDRVDCDRANAYTIGDPEDLIQREPYVATFRTKVDPADAFTFTLINVHTTPEPAPTLRGELDALAEVYRVVRRAGINEDDVIMLGDFNADDAHFGRLGQIPGIAPLIRGRGVFTNTKRNMLRDNIIIHEPSTTEFVARSGVFDVMKQYNLKLNEAESVSDHFPVWAEFSMYEKDINGNYASRRGTMR